MNRFRRTFSSVYHSLYFPPTVILLTIMVVMVFTWHASIASLNQDIVTSANTHVRLTEQEIHANLGAYEEILQGGVGLFQGSNEVTKADWSHYLQAFDLKHDYDGTQGIGFLQTVTTSQLPDLTAYMATQGVDGFAILPIDPAHTDPNQDTFAPVVYAQVVASSNTPRYGFDMYSEPKRRQALYQARDSGETTMTNRIALTIGGEPAPVNGFYLFVPYYAVEQPLSTVAEHQTAIRGYTYAAFRADVFFTTVATSADNKNAGFRITVAGDPAGGTLYQSAHFDSVQDRSKAVHIVRPLRLYGQTWNIEYVFDRSGLVSQVQLRRPPSALFGGIFIAILIATIVLLILKGRARELTAQKERAVELAKDELLSIASHQLRTPATGVKQYVGMVLQDFAGTVPKEQRTLLEKAYASNDRQLQIINEILHLAKIEAGRIVLAPTPTDMNHLISDIMGEQRPDILAAKHHIVIDLPKRPIMLNIDAHMLRMAIENVISNAVKYTRSGGQISVELFRRMGHVYIRVSDNGVGVAPSDQAELFKQFTRLPNEMSQNVDGTGIGLYLAKHLVELHRGTITVESEPNKGSTFTIILPG